MDLTHPAPVRHSLDRVGQVLTGLTVNDELAVCDAEVDLWRTGSGAAAVEPPGPLAQVAELRALGAYALPLPDLLARVGRGYVPLPGGAGSVALGWPDAGAPWNPGDALAVELTGGAARGRVAVAPICAPAAGVAFLARAGDGIALARVAAPGENGRRACSAGRLGDAFELHFDGAPVDILARDEQAVDAWRRAVLWERLAWLGLTAGAIDRSWRIALDALCEGTRQGHFLAGEQVAQFQLADNDIERMAAEHLVLDTAIDVEQGRPHAPEKLALTRYFTSAQAERCAARALHVAQLFLPRLVPVARWLTRRAHHLSVFGMAREHEVRLATQGLAAGMSLE